MQQPTVERDFYRALLDLAEPGELETLLRRALDLVLHVTGADRGVLDLGQLSLAHGFDDSDLRAISLGILELVRSDRAVVRTTSARVDERFRDRPSVRRHAIEAVLCAPVGAGGVLYLQKPTGAAAFTDIDVEHVQLLVRQLRPLAAHHLSRDHAKGWRDRLQGADSVIGTSELLAEVFRQVAVVAPLPLSVLITGPTGTGKSTLARILHRNSSARGPLVELNCAAIPIELAESELFGASRGAHSTATRDLPGKVEAADGGTLFLDEVGDLPLPVQAKLLQFLQDGAYHRLGDTRTRRATVRVVSATHQDLEGAVRERTFRADLYYRLAGFTIQIPSLDERAEDVPLIARALLHAACDRFRLPRPSNEDALLAEIACSRWPGNVRELAAAIDRALLLAGPGGEVRLGEPAAPVSTYRDRMRAHQRAILEDALGAHGTVTAAAEALGLSRSRAYELISDLRIEGGDRL